MKQFLSPRQVAQSMGVSESSLKRWCDRGILETQRTSGGHRKIPVSSVVRFLRDNSRELVRPEIIGLPSRSHETPQGLDEAIQQLTQSLTLGDAPACQRIIFSLFLDGRSSAQICDDLITPALALIGQRWAQGDVEIFEEHRAVEILRRVLLSLREAIGPPQASAPIAIGGAAEGDHYGLPTLMIELALTEAGWQATSLGTSLPYGTLESAIRKTDPRLFWLSLSTANESPTFLDQLSEFSERASLSTSVFIGGRAVTTDMVEGLRHVTSCENIQQIVVHAKTMESKI